MRYDLSFKSTLLLLCLFACVTDIAAQVREDSVSVHEFKISYPINKATLHTDYQDNAKHLKIIREQFEKSPRIDSIVIYSYASPEGPYKWNKTLAERRGKSALEYLKSIIPEHSSFPDSLIIIKPVAENWEGLNEMVRERYPFDDRNEIIDLINSKPSCIRPPSPHFRTSRSTEYGNGETMWYAATRPRYPTPTST